MGIIDDYGIILLILAVLFGIFMAWGVGANDVANAMGTSVGAKAITIKQAIVIAMVFEFAGAYLAGGEVTSTIRKGIVDPEALADTPELFVYGMLAALLAQFILPVPGLGGLARGGNMAIGGDSVWLACIHHTQHRGCHYRLCLRGYRY